ncbi:MAG TPA: hypothetical protein VNL71_07905 [Chloroflexota bacterium]|nr:hypothetical protein [Chloroflexota bacterium]
MRHLYRHHYGGPSGFLQGGVIEKLPEDESTAGVLEKDEQDAPDDVAQG